MAMMKGETDRSERRNVPNDRHRRDQEQQHDRDRATSVGPPEQGDPGRDHRDQPRETAD
jgi:hypothetical protein